MGIQFRNLNQKRTDYGVRRSQHYSVNACSLFLLLSLLHLFSVCLYHHHHHPSTKQ
ncbi:uncharacterized protein BP01DRAFT_358216 [Aspergillus saccharolyticus JOP 1030-1]|uniref:Uncharacterized protein n=1 Tax=Aspergillus saccharolyticus JOP 1030-1 TaxID=1450539 RepID=A0A318ZUM6_9EURO|nr:hypothetical protein BP01DRAFT_358216 [Aspergillus saccharolyticus JOP 1030-1]PYH43788.1 hypothetical protein BP01DRAFT_358216 [Aspergillus saccharolyticus JOP 1030-1]